MPLEQKAGTLRYRVFGLTLACDVPLQELASVAVTEPDIDVDIRVRFSGPRENGPSPRWFISWKSPTGEAWLSAAKVDRGYLLRFPKLADFFVDEKGRELLCAAELDTPPHTLHHLLLNQMLPLIFNLRGQEALHATAVLTPWGVCAFTGPAGAGKSTLAASFLLAGYPVLSDDCLVLQERAGQIFAVPAYPELRLWEDSWEALYQEHDRSIPIADYTSKRRVVFKEHSVDFPTVPQPLARIYILPEPSEPNGSGDIAEPFIERITRREGFMELLMSLFRLDVTDRTMLTRQFHFLDRLLSLVPVGRLRMPGTFSALPATRETILTDLQSH